MKKKVIIGSGCLGATIMTVLGTLVLFALVLFFGVGLFSILGFKYNSMQDIIKFFAIYSVMDFIVSGILEAITRLIKSSNRFTTVQFRIIYFSLDVFVQIVIISIINTIMDTINIPQLTIALFAIIAHIIGMLIDFKSDTSDKHEDK